jgi:heme ABC exporter ATP-binding subunit CcmA
VFVLLVVVVAFVLVGNVLRGTTGRRLLAVRSNERAAAAIGIDVRSVKLGAFALSSGLAGLGGALIATSRGQLSSASFGVFVGLGFLAVTYLSGIASMSGAVVAGALVALGVVYVVLDRSLGVAAYYALISGPLLIITVIVNPSGIAGRTRSIVHRLRGSARRERPTDAGVSGEASVVAARPWSRDGAPAEPPPAEREVGEVVLRLDDITVDFGGLRAVDRVTLELRAGQIVGLIGPNGAGKTTLLMIVAGAVRPAAGRVRIEGGDPEQRQETDIGLLAHRTAIKARLTVAENLKFWAAVNGVAAGGVEAALETVGLLPIADLDAGVLSAGQTRRLALARLVHSDRPVWLLDEPTAALDADGEKLVARLIDAHLDCGGLVLAATHHDLGLAHASHVVALGQPAVAV